MDLKCLCLYWNLRTVIISVLSFAGVFCCYTNGAIMNRWLADNRRVKKESDSYLLNLFDL